MWFKRPYLQKVTYSGFLSACVPEIPFQKAVPGTFGLVLCFLHQSVMIELVHARTFLAGTGGGWIVLGLVNEDRF